MDNGHEIEAGINCRIVAMLRAVSAGRAELSLSSEPDLFVDGLACSDQPAAHTLVRTGLIRAARPGRFGEHVPAILTSQGRAVLRTIDPLPSTA